MKLSVVRSFFLEKCTIGKMFIDGQDLGIFTLEDVVRADGIKIPGATAIPAGAYKVIIDFSNHFQRDLPHILDVPNFVGVRIHPGNTDSDTQGCLLLGLDWDGGDFIGRSRDAFDVVFPKIQASDSVEIEIA